MAILEKNGFIRVKQMANRRYAYVLLVHPEVALERLGAAGRVPAAWLEAYRDRQMETGETAVVDPDAASTETTTGGVAEFPF